MDWLISTDGARVGAGRVHKGRSLVWGGALCLALMVALLVSACDQTAAKKPAPTQAPATAAAPSSDALPTFSDWRAAYLGADGRVHAVTLDGKTDVVGPVLPGLTSPDLGFWSGGIAPNGRFVAYAPLSLRVIDLTGQRTDMVHVGGAYAMVWSLDSSQLALDEGDGTLAIYNTQSGVTTAIQGMPPRTVGGPVGWIDSTHLAITDIANQTSVVSLNGQDGYATSYAVAALDITTGRVRVIATIRSPGGLGLALFTLSPDGHKILFSNRPYRDYPYTPLVDEIDVATGAITPLPGIDRATGSGFTSVAWQPGTDMVAVSTDFIVNGDLKNWLLDLGHDQAHPLPNSGFVAGWAPGSSVLVLTTGQQITNGTGPFTLTALAVGTTGQVASSTTLTQAAMTFPFIGFVRTA